MTAAKIGAYLAHRWRNSLVAPVFEQTQGVKPPLTLNSSWSDSCLRAEGDLGPVPLASASEDACSLLEGAVRASSPGAGPRSTAILTCLSVCLSRRFFPVCEVWVGSLALGGGSSYSTCLAVSTLRRPMLSAARGTWLGEVVSEHGGEASGEGIWLTQRLMLFSSQLGTDLSVLVLRL